MSRQLCPKCEDHPILDDCLCCMFCKGSYEWKEKNKKWKCLICKEEVNENEPCKCMRTAMNEDAKK